MPTCPRCKQLVDAQAIACPTCRTTLKAYGHPGIPLYRATGEEYLCATCIYHADDTCNYPQRPHAQECTLYQNPQMQQQARPKPSQFSLALWVKRNAGWLILAGLAVIIVVNALRTS
jgi:Double zinc ribbon